MLQFQQMMADCFTPMDWQQRIPSHPGLIIAQGWSVSLCQKGPPYAVYQKMSTMKCLCRFTQPQQWTTCCSDAANTQVLLGHSCTFDKWSRPMTSHVYQISPFQCWLACAVMFSYISSIWLFPSLPCFRLKILPTYLHSNGHFPDKQGLAGPPLFPIHLIQKRKFGNKWPRSCRHPTNNDKALKETQSTESNLAWPGLTFSSSITRLWTAGSKG